MRVKVYKCLDEPSSTFGLKGSYWRYMLYCVGGSVLAGIAVSRVTGGLVGLIVALALVMVAYFVLMAVQASLSERERKKWWSSLALPDFIAVDPEPMRDAVEIDLRSEN